MIQLIDDLQIIVVHLFLQDIDSYINKASDQGYSAIIRVGSQGFTYASNMLLNTAIKVSTLLLELPLVKPLLQSFLVTLVC